MGKGVDDNDAIKTILVDFLGANLCENNPGENENDVGAECLGEWAGLVEFAGLGSTLSGGS